MDRMLAGMPARMLDEWMAFDRLEPISLAWRGDLQAGIVASMLANIYRNPQRRPEPYTPEDFVPRFETILPEEPEDIYKRFRSWAIMAGAKVKQ